MLFFVLFFLFVSVQAAVYEGDLCNVNGRQGTCTNLKICQSAIRDLQNQIRPKICAFDGEDPIVCCLETQPVLTTSRPPPRPTEPTTPYVPPVYDYVDLSGNKYGGCEPLPSSLAASRNGRKAWDKCLEYQEKFIYPCERSQALSGDLSRSNNCKHNADELVTGGVDAAPHEFPHMALLGYAGVNSGLNWRCGGALVSERFVLTAGHCIADSSGQEVTHVQVGIHRRSTDLSESKTFKVERIIPHPQYKSPIKYNDIALLELEKPVPLDQFTVPACLHTGEAVDDERALATGWGQTKYRGDNADILQKVILKKFSTPNCSAKNPPFRKMMRGIDERTQMCFGDSTESKDTCYGDSGGPLQIKSAKINCMYVIVGVTSFGPACGFKVQPGVYTQVAPFTPWIESIVWP